MIKRNILLTYIQRPSNFLTSYQCPYNVVLTTMQADLIAIYGVIYLLYLLPWTRLFRNKSLKKTPKNSTGKISEMEECIFVYIALHIECRFRKNSLLQCLVFTVFFSLVNNFVLFLRFTQRLSTSRSTILRNVDNRMFHSSLYINRHHYHHHHHHEILPNSPPTVCSPQLCICQSSDGKMPC